MASQSPLVMELLAVISFGVLSVGGEDMKGWIMTFVLSIGFITTDTLEAIDYSQWNDALNNTQTAIYKKVLPSREKAVLRATILPLGPQSLAA